MNIHPLCAMFPEMSPDEFNGLLESINANGLRHPITLYEGQVLDGRHRLKACDELGIEPSYVQFEGGFDDARVFVRVENLEHRNLTEGQRAALVEELAALTPGGDRKSEEFQSTRVDFDSEPTVDEVAKMGGVSRSTIFNVRKVRREGDPEVFEALKRGEVSPTDAARVADASHDDQREALKRVQDSKAKTLTSAANIMRNERLSEETMPELPDGEYRVVVIDPPWPIVFNPDPSGRLDQSGQPPYPTMTLDEIKDMTLPLADDAWVFLWTIQQFLFDCPAVFDAWGVERCFTMTWLKTHGPQTVGRPQSNLEFVIVGRRGKPAFRTTKEFSMGFQAPNQSEHSRKPVEFYELLNRVTVGPRIDLFSRRPIEGFDAWGKEARS